MVRCKIFEHGAAIESVKDQINLYRDILGETEGIATFSRSYRSVATRPYIYILEYVVMNLTVMH